MSEQKTEPATTPKRKYSYWFTIRLMGMDHEIEAIRRYLETVTSSIEREFQGFTEDLKQRAKGADEESMESFGEEYAEEAAHFVDHFPNFTLQNTFVATYALLEDELLAVARYAGRRLGFKLDPDQLSDTGIRAAQTYLVALCGIAFPDSKHPWQEVLHYNRLRNICVHARGVVKKENNKARSYVASRKSITIDATDRLQLTKEFCFEAIGNIRALLVDVMMLVKDRVG